MSIGRLTLGMRAIRGARLGPSRRPRHKDGAGQGAPRGKVAGSEGRLARPSSRQAPVAQRGGAARAPAGRVARRPHSAVGACAARWRSPTPFSWPPLARSSFAARRSAPRSAQEGWNRRDDATRDGDNAQHGPAAPPSRAAAAHQRAHGGPCCLPHRPCESSTGLTPRDGT